MLRSLSHKIDDLSHFCKGRRAIPLSELFNHLGPVGPAFFSLIFSIPFLFFAKIPVVMMILGLIIFISGLRIALHKPIWMPQFIRKHKISGDRLSHKLPKWAAFFKKIEKVIHPRGTIYQKSPFLQAFNGFILSLCGLFLFLPLSPISTFLPALGVFLLSLGIIEEDIRMMIFAYVVLLLKLLLLFIPLII
jgi:hypothetical protein